MTHAFKAGDKVRCINIRGTYGISLGQEFEVAGVLDRDWFYIKGKPGNWTTAKFELVSSLVPTFKAGDKVRCILSAGTTLLTKGKLYEVTHTTSQHGNEYVTVASDTRPGTYVSMLSSRFQLVNHRVYSKNAPRRPQAGTKDAAILDLLLVGTEMTRVLAMHYGVMQLPTSVHRLRALGWDIKTTLKKDVRGQRYGSVTLNEEQRALVAA